MYVKYDKTFRGSLKNTKHLQYPIVVTESYNSRPSLSPSVQSHFQSYLYHVKKDNSPIGVVSENYYKFLSQHSLHSNNIYMTNHLQ